MIIFKKLKWSNCFSYGGDNEISLNSDPVTQMIGLNGTGKSSIPLILEEVLYNKNSKGIKKSDIANRIINKPYTIELSLSSNNEEYKIKYTRGKTVKLQLFKDGEDISSHTATNTLKQVEEIVGLDFKTFSQLVYQNTSSSLAFLTATDIERKRFLIELLNLNKYIEYHEKFKEIARQLTIEKTKVETEIITLEKWLEENNLEGMMVLSSVKIEISTETEELERAKLQEEIKNIALLNKKIEKNNLYKKQLAAIDLNSFSDVKITQEISTHNTSMRLGELLADQKTAQKELNQLVKLKDKCPTCLQDINTEFKESLINKYSEIVISCKNEINKLTKELNETKELNKRLKEKLLAESEFENLFRAIKHDLQTNLLSESDLKNKLILVEKAIASKKKEIEALITKNLAVERNNTKISLIKEQSEKIKEKLKKAKLALNTNIEKLNRIEILKKVFGTNGLLAYKIENLIKDLEDLVNEYLVELSDGRFSLLFIAEKDKLNIELADNGIIVDINALSSGELARVNTATLLAIRKLMNSLSKTQINLLFLDEIISVLDEAGKDKLVEILLKEDELNTFLISHGWTHPLLAKLEILKENEISRIEL
jgi:DNA repair exonuclease SbcCD ATPase subunit